jgi:hypothetical protein
VTQPVPPGVAKPPYPSVRKISISPSARDLRLLARAKFPSSSARVISVS